jgi:hypothetical protein
VPSYVISTGISSSVSSGRGAGSSPSITNFSFRREEREERRGVRGERRGEERRKEVLKLFYFYLIITIPPLLYGIITCYGNSRGDSS